MTDGPAPSLARRAVAEGVGTALLLAAVVGPGIMGERLASGNVGLALLANAVATGAALPTLPWMEPPRGVGCRGCAGELGAWRPDRAAGARVDPATGLSQPTVSGA